MNVPAVAVLEPRDRRRLFIAAAVAMFVFGIVLAILGTLFGLPGMRERLQIDLARQGDVFLVLFLGILVSTLLCGPVMDSAGHRIVLTASSVFVVIALLLLEQSRSFAPAVIAAFVLGFGGGGLNTSSNALVADIYVDDRGAMLAILGAFFGVGALVIPVSAAVLTGLFSISQLLVATAALGVAAAFICLVPRYPPPRRTAQFSIFASLRAARIAGVLTIALLLFIESGNEAAVGGWTSTYAGTMGASPRTATWILAAYWAALMFGRFLCARVQRYISGMRLVLLSAVGSAVGCAVLLASTSLGVMTFGGVVVGFSFASIYPTTLAVAADRYERSAATVFGLLFALGLAGGMVFPWAVGHISEWFGLRVAMALPIAGGLGIAALAAAIGRSR
jgi:FHS family glucose/mannose:H+ symporter-like MFS transporter